MALHHIDTDDDVDDRPLVLRAVDRPDDAQQLQGTEVAQGGTDGALAELGLAT